MGVPGLTSYAKKNVPSERVNLTARGKQMQQTITLAVDVSALAYYLGCNHKIVPFHTGGQYYELAEATTKFVTDLRTRGIELRGIVDGLASKQKSLTMLSRLYDSLQDRKEVMRQLTTYGRDASIFNGRGPFVKPPLLQETVLSALKSCHVPLIRAQREADDLLAHSARPYGGSCHAVLSNDSDFLIYETGPLIMFDGISIVEPNEEFPHGYIVARMYSRDRVAKSLGIRPSLMPVLASLVGTDSTPPKQEIHHRLSAVNKTKSKKSYNKTNVVVQAGRYVRDFTRSNPSILPTDDTSYDTALASALFGTIVNKSNGKRNSNNKKRKKRKRDTCNNVNSNINTTTLIEYLHKGRTRYNMSMTMEEWNNRLKPEYWRSFHSCEYDHNLTEIIVDKNFTWGRPPLEGIDSYMICSPLRERLYSYLFSNEISNEIQPMVINPKESNPKDSTSNVDDGDLQMKSTNKINVDGNERLRSLVTSSSGTKSSSSNTFSLSSLPASIIITESRRVHKKKKSKPFSITITSTNTLSMNDVLYGSGGDHEKLWNPTKEKYNNTFETMICRVLYNLIINNNTLKSKILDPDERVLNHIHKLMSKGEKRNFKKANKNPNNLNFVERLTIYTLLQVVYLHIRMILQGFNKNILCGEYSKTPQILFSHLPKWVNGNDETNQEEDGTKGSGKIILNRKGQVKGINRNNTKCMLWREVLKTEYKSDRQDDPMDIEDL
jgi:hypothetical protein